MKQLIILSIVFLLALPSLALAQTEAVKAVNMPPIDIVCDLSSDINKILILSNTPIESQAKVFYPSVYERFNRDTSDYELITVEPIDEEFTESKLLMDVKPIPNFEHILEYEYKYTLDLTKQPGCFETVFMIVESTDFGVSMVCDMYTYRGKTIPIESDCYNPRLNQMQEYLNKKQELESTDLETAIKAYDFFMVTLRDTNTFEMIADFYCHYNNYTINSYSFPPCWEATDNLIFNRMEYEAILKDNFDLYDSLVKTGEASPIYGKITMLQQVWDSADHDKKVELAERYYVSQLKAGEHERTYALDGIGEETQKLRKICGENTTLKFIESIDGQPIFIHYYHFDFVNMKAFEESTSDIPKYENVETSCVIDRDIIWELDAYKLQHDREDIAYLFHTIKAIITGDMKVKPFTGFLYFFQSYVRTQPTDDYSTR